MKLAPIPSNPNAYECFIPGNEGITAVAIIETSHIIMHSWFGDGGDVYQVDMYSCAPFEPDDGLAFVSKSFRLTQCRHRLINRDRL
jgi:S-adenosylmethionine/arginine decarboxylase-like enzyme